MEHEHMHKVCKSVLGLMMFVAGLAFLGFGYGQMSAILTYKIAGWALTLFGLGKLAHSFMLCPMCNNAAKKEK